jgi:hypothetical protein
MNKREVNRRVGRELLLTQRMQNSIFAQLTHFIPGTDGNLSLVFAGVVGASGELFIKAKMGNWPFFPAS